jgi:hypothetical protein
MGIVARFDKRDLRSLSTALETETPRPYFRHVAKEVSFAWYDTTTQLV